MPIAVDDGKFVSVISTNSINNFVATLNKINVNVKNMYKDEVAKLLLSHKKDNNPIIMFSTFKAF